MEQSNLATPIPSIDMDTERFKYACSFQELLTYSLLPEFDLTYILYRSFSYGYYTYIRATHAHTKKKLKKQKPSK